MLCIKQTDFSKNRIPAESHLFRIYPKLYYISYTYRCSPRRRTGMQNPPFGASTTPPQKPLHTTGIGKARQKRHDMAAAAIRNLRIRGRFAGRTSSARKR